MFNFVSDLLFCKRRNPINKEIMLDDENPVKDSELDSKFKLISKKVSKISSKLEVSQILIFYGLYKQAQLGNADIEDKPSMLDLANKAKLYFLS